MDKAQAAEVVRQIGGGKALLMMGINHKNPMYVNENYLVMKPKGSRKWNYIKIALNVMDTYDVTFGKFTLKKGLTKTEEFNNIYNDQLTDLIEKQTGLYLSL